MAGKQCKLKIFKEALAIWIHVNFFTYVRAVTGSVFLYFILFGGISRYLAIAYALWVIWDWNTIKREGRPWKWLKRGSYTRHCTDYFPLKNVALTDIPANKNYIAPCYPHGVLAMGALFAFCADPCSVLERLGLRSTVCTLNFNFPFPLVREYYLGMGLTSVDGSAIRYQLECNGVGNIVAIVVGGSAEANYCKSGVYKIVLNKRKGFCRVALQTGAHLLPTFCFGEVDAYEVDKFPDNVFKSYFQKLTGVNLLLFHGVPRWLSIFGLPKRRPITVVMGAPIPVEKVENPTSDDIDTLHATFVNAIKTLFNTEKHKYVENPDDTELTIL